MSFSGSTVAGIRLSFQGFNPFKLNLDCENLDNCASNALDRTQTFASEGSEWTGFAGLALLAFVLFALRLAAPPNLLDQDQENPASYVLDVVQNGNWICQRDVAGGITSKPPLYTWCAALVSLALGKVTLFSLYFPGALALLGSACLVLFYGRNHFGPRAGLLGGLACFLCAAGMKQLALARTDGVFAFTVTVAALLAYQAWISGRGWFGFWLAAAAATLTKGPLGLVLAANGLLAILWDRRSREPLPLRGSPLPGAFLFLLITGGWLLLGWLGFGHALIDKLFVKELMFHVVEGEHKTVPGSLFYLSPLYYLARAAPWSLMAYYGLWRIWKYPAADPSVRRFERFLFCWFLAGLILFSLSPHQRGDLLWPLMPAGALIAGRELARLTSRLTSKSFAFAVFALVLFATLGFGIFYFGHHARHPIVRQTVALRTLARELQKQRGVVPLTHTDDPVGLQIFLNTFQRPVSMDEAVQVLRSTNAAFVAVHDLAKLNAARKQGDPPIHILLEDDGPVNKLRVHIVSNRTSFER